MWEVLHVICLVCSLKFLLLFTVTVGKGDCNGELIQDFSKVVYPENVSYEEITKNVFHLVFQISDGERRLYFNLHTRSDVLDSESDFCQMQGLVHTQHTSTSIELAVCNGIVGTISGNSSKVEVIRPVLMNDEGVSFHMLSSTPHVLMTIDAEDELPIYSNFDTHEILREFNMTNQKTRRRRRIRYITMSVINKADTNVHLYYMNPRTHRRQYFIRLRLNEKNIVQSYIGTTWLAYDRKQQPLLVNKRYNLLLLDRHADKKIDVVITSRKKYSETDYNKAQKPRYLEVLAVADQSFVKKHGNQTMARKFIAAVISGVNMVFRHKSLNATLHVILKSVKFLSENEKVEITTKDPKKSLANACNYMFDEKKRNTNLKFEFGIFFTRTKFGYSGFTPLYRMCVDYKSCTLIHGTGLQTAFIVAHEIGHSVGLSHDGDLNTCLNDTVAGSIMAPFIRSRFNQYHWSKCSKKQIKDNLQYFSCLDNVPANYKIPSPTNLPGDMYGIDDQCRYTFGEGYHGCLGRRSPNQYCSYLFCKYPSTKNRCSYYPLPRADGTKCNKDYWCVEGKCLPYGRLTPDPVDGGWSQWSTWGRCSQSCGQGVRIRKRYCDNPRPVFGGKACNGSMNDWQLCKYNDCSFDPVFADKRSNACYFLYGSGWQWFPEEEIAERVRSLKLQCNFESGFGSWSHSNKTKFKWKLNNGSTPTYGTGPKVDHTHGNTSGRYMFFEASHPVVNGDQALLLSVPILVPHICLKMYYHMSGTSVGTLRILKMHLNETVAEELWIRKGVAGKHWYNIALNVTHNQQYRLGIEATRLNSYMSDISIDDIKIKEGNCLHTEKDRDESCKLYCQNAKENYLNIHKPIPNGMRCDKEFNDICVLGKCERAGCDNKIGSMLKYDVCGVCDGQNKSCSLQNIHLKVRLQKLSQPIFTIPQGCAKFKLIKSSPTVVKLAIKDTKNKFLYYYDDVTGGSYKWNYLNIGSSTIRYQTFLNQTEIIYIEKVNKNTNAEIQLIAPGSIVNSTSVIDLKYTFYLSNATKHDIFSWLFHEWSNCSSLCGGGNRTAIHKCYNVGKHEVADTLKCSSSATQIVNPTVACNTHKCRIIYKYWPGGWSKCSTCGRVGFMTRKVLCVKQIEGQKLYTTNTTMCEGIKYKPRNKTRCYVPCQTILRTCNERSRLCPGYVKKGYCSYRTVQTLCCKSCKPAVENKSQPPS